MSTETTGAITIQPGALLATASAETTVEQLNHALAPHRLCLPVFPLVTGLTLAELVLRNAGGRRRLRYGPIGRYLRAAVLTGRDADDDPITLEIGGPTMKRATGYGLNRAIAGGAIDLGTLRALTFSLRPLPADRAATLVRCPDLAAACGLAARLYASGLALSALAVARTEAEHEAEGGALLLAELEGASTVVTRQRAAIVAAVAAAGAQVLPDGGEPWRRWEDLAAAHSVPGLPALDLTMPRAALPSFVTRAQWLARRYGLPLALWGDAGLGALHLMAWAPGHAAEAGQLMLVLRALATEAGGALATEFGLAVAPPPVVVTAPPPVHPAVSTYALRAKLRDIVGAGYLLTRPEELSCYETDASRAKPLGSAFAVALPASTEEVAALLRVAAAHGVPVVTRGAGSGFAGGATPSAGALVVALNRLQRITVDREQMVVHVGAGAITAEVQRAVEAVGLFYPPDPASQATSTMGGNIACNAGGPRCVKYGVTADYVLAVTAVLADGSVVQWGDGLVGQGPDSGLAQLLVGSEGTLGLITEATMRVIPLPVSKRTTMAIFPSLEAACATVERMMAAGLVPAGLELMDDACLAAIERCLQLGLPADAGAMLLMLADGEPEAVEADAAALAALALAGGATSVQVAQNAADEARLWQARRGIANTLSRMRPNRLSEDICVPLSQIATCVRRIKAASVEHGLPIIVFGHAGDGNLHPSILFDASDTAQRSRSWLCAEAIFMAALAVGGTLSGEHGIGILKKPFMHLALSAATLAAQRHLKAQFDPAGLLNPGKIFPA